jgi:hypothetical protein
MPEMLLWMSPLMRAVAWRLRMNALRILLRV